MTDDILLIDTDERVRTLTLNRPQSRNALSAALRDRFFAALADAEADDDIDVVILTGAVYRSSQAWQGQRRLDAHPGHIAIEQHGVVNDRLAVDQGLLFGRQPLCSADDYRPGLVTD